MPGLRFSRYEFAPVHEDEYGRIFLDVPDPITKRTFSEDVQSLIGEGDTVHSLAAIRYEAMLDREQDIRPESFFWVVAQVNDVLDPEGILDGVDGGPLQIGETARVFSVQTLIGDILIPPPFFEQSEVV